jgi:hypothetical protein
MVETTATASAAADQYGVDFVLAGHDHDYERCYVVKGTDPGTILRPHVVSTDLSNVDSDLGLVHLVIGTGGGCHQPGPSLGARPSPPRSRRTTARC